MPTPSPELELAQGLAGDHVPATLAAALVLRLRADGHPELASVVALLARVGILDPNPPTPHREGPAT